MPELSTYVIEVERRHSGTFRVPAANHEEAEAFVKSLLDGYACDDLTGVLVGSETYHVSTKCPAIDADETIDELSQAHSLYEDRLVLELDGQGGFLGIRSDCDDEDYLKPVASARTEGEGLALLAGWQPASAASESRDADGGLVEVAFPSVSLEREVSLGGEPLDTACDPVAVVDDLRGLSLEAANACRRWRSDHALIHAAPGCRFTALTDED